MIKTLEKAIQNKENFYEPDKISECFERLSQLSAEITYRTFPYICGEVYFYRTVVGQFKQISKIEKELGIPIYNWNQQQIEDCLCGMTYTHDMACAYVVIKDYIQHNNPNNKVIDNIVVENLVPNIVKNMPTDLDDMLRTVDLNARQKGYNEEMIISIKIGAVLIYYGELLDNINHFNLEGYLTKDYLILNAQTPCEIKVPIAKIPKSILQLISFAKRTIGTYYKYGRQSTKSMLARICVPTRLINEFGVYTRIFNSDMTINYAKRSGKTIDELCAALNRQAGYKKFHYTSRWSYDKFVLRYFQWRYLVYGVPYDILPLI